MSAHRMLIRYSRPLSRLQPFLLCQSRHFIKPSQRYASTKATTSSNWSRHVSLSRIWRSHFSTDGMTPQQVRDEVDTRARKGYYIMIHNEGMIVMDPITANDIYTEFVGEAKKNTDYATIVSSLAQKHKIKVSDISSLAIATFRIADINDPKRKVPPSQHKAMSMLLLQACARTKDPLAVLHILNSVYLSTLGTLQAAKDIARLFSVTERSNCMRILEELASEGNAEALTLQGQFLEREGKKQQAKVLYEKALEKVSFEYDPTAGHPMALPQIMPWNALGYLLKAEKNPNAQVLAKQAFEKGALKGDDPIAYFELASYEDGMTADWLKYMTKAAASGHLEAMYILGNYLMDLNSDPSAALKDSRTQKALNWLTSWKSGSAAVYAQEWFEMAAKFGHKPSMMELAEFHRSEGDVEKAREYWKQMLDYPSSDSREEWPHLVKQAKERLASVRA